ncbi:hypothetical protein ABZX92_23565 [Lentzea sp. NPDC006480]
MTFCRAVRREVSAEIAVSHRSDAEHNAAIGSFVRAWTHYPAKAA